MNFDKKKKILGFSLLIFYLSAAIILFFGVSVAIVIDPSLTLDSHLILGLIAGLAF
jgi:hypothetical protein